MSSTQDIRWKQRFNSFKEALSQLKAAADLAQQRPLTDLEKQGIIQAFEFTHELSWNVLKDYFQFQGNTSITGSRDAAKEAFQKGLISNGDVWMEMIISRNKTSHTYNKKIADEIVGKILNQYLKEFLLLKIKMQDFEKQ